MLRMLSRLIKGGKRVKLVDGPGNNISFILDGKAQSLEYEVKGEKHYYRWSGLSDGCHELYTYLGVDNLQQQKNMFSKFSDTDALSVKTICTETHLPTRKR